jgi:predicted O-methyltransferase YrrM
VAPVVRDRLHSVVNSEAATRARLEIAAARVRRNGSAGRALIAEGIAAARTGELDPGEREWMERIAARRDRIGVELVSVTPTCGRLLLRLARRRPQGDAIELGTAFGISSAYIAAGLELSGGGRLITLDVREDWGEIAGEGLAELELADRVDRRVGWITETLPPALEDASPVGLAFVDAEHESEPMRRYYHALLPHMAPGGVIVFDDITFSHDAWRGWRAIRRHAGSGSAFHLGRVGVVTVNRAG